MHECSMLLQTFNMLPACLARSVPMSLTPDHLRLVYGATHHDAAVLIVSRPPASGPRLSTAGRGYAGFCRMAPGCRQVVFCRPVGCNESAAIHYVQSVAAWPYRRTATSRHRATKMPTSTCSTSSPSWQRSALMLARPMCLPPCAQIRHCFLFHERAVHALQKPSSHQTLPSMSQWWPDMSRQQRDPMRPPARSFARASLWHKLPCLLLTAATSRDVCVWSIAVLHVRVDGGRHTGGAARRHPGQRDGQLPRSQLQHADRAGEPEGPPARECS